MGLDYVELVLAIEDKFGIHIDDEEAGSARTVGDLYAIIMAKVEPEVTVGQRRCLTSAAFYRTRRGITETLGLSRREIRPSTPLAPILPWPRRNRFWRSIQIESGFALPKLRHPSWVQNGVLGAGLLCSLVFAQTTKTSFRDISTVTLVYLSGLCSGGVLLWITKPLAFGLPREVATVGDLAKSVLKINYARFIASVGQPSRKDVWDTLSGLMVKQLGLSPDQIRPEATILDDLGID